MSNKLRVKFEQVQQRGDGDCGIACFSMITGESYDFCREKIFKNFKSNQGLTECAMLGALAYHFGVHVALTNGWVDSMPGICTVPSLNHPGLLHFVIWTGTDVLDPQAGMPGMRAYTKEMMRFAVVSQIYSFDIEAMA